MGKKKTVDDVTVRADNAVALAWGDVATIAGRKDVAVDVADVPYILPLPSLAARYLYQNEGLVLSRFHEIVGPEASYKSTFAAEVMRWHRLAGGYGLLALAETKDNKELRNSVLGWDFDWLKIENVQSMNEWQQILTWSTKNLQKRFEQADGPGKTIPVCLGIDSLCGKATQESIDKVLEVGFAGKAFPDQAQSLTRYCQAFTQMLLGWPFTLIGVNHCKKSLVEGQEEENIPGGRELSYQAATIIHMQQVKQTEAAEYTLSTVRMRTLKNSYGKKKRQINVDIRFWYQEDAPGVYRLYSRFEWWAASIYLLAGEFFNKQTASRMLGELREIVDVHEKAAGTYGKLYWSTALGVPSSDPIPAHDLGVMLEMRGDLLEKLYRVLTIARRDYFMPAVNFMSQFPEYAHLAEQAKAAAAAVKAAENAKPGESAPPIRRKGGGDDEE